LISGTAPVVNQWCDGQCALWLCSRVTMVLTVHVSHQQRQPAMMSRQRVHLSSCSPQ